MRVISDLTKDTRPKLEDILEKSIKSVASIDLQKENNDSLLIEYENHSFYYRVIFLFMQNSIDYYTEEEIEVWSKRELLNEIVLPKI